MAHTEISLLSRQALEEKLRALFEKNKKLRIKCKRRAAALERLGHGEKESGSEDEDADAVGAAETPLRVPKQPASAAFPYQLRLEDWQSSSATEDARRLSTGRNSLVLPTGFEPCAGLKGLQPVIESRKQHQLKFALYDARNPSMAQAEVHRALCALANVKEIYFQLQLVYDSDLTPVKMSDLCRRAQNTLRGLAEPNVFEAKFMLKESGEVDITRFRLGVHSAHTISPGRKFRYHLRCTTAFENFEQLGALSPAFVSKKRLETRGGVALSEL